MLHDHCVHATRVVSRGPYRENDAEVLQKQRQEVVSSLESWGGNCASVCACVCDFVCLCVCCVYVCVMCVCDVYVCVCVFGSRLGVVVTHGLSSRGRPK